MRVHPPPTGQNSSQHCDQLKRSLILKKWVLKKFIFLLMTIKADGAFSLHEAGEILIQTFDGIKKNPLTTECNKLAPKTEKHNTYGLCNHPNIGIKRIYCIE